MKKFVPVPVQSPPLSGYLVADKNRNLDKRYVGETREELSRSFADSSGLSLFQEEAVGQKKVFSFRATPVASFSLKEVLTSPVQGTEK